MAHYVTALITSNLIMNNSIITAMKPTWHMLSLADVSERVLEEVS